MNRSRGKALTGEFKKEVLHFGKLISRVDGIVFFSAKIGDESGPQCISAVLDEFVVNVNRDLSVGAYATRVNSIAEEVNLISPILELGMAPDNKPFFISEEPVGDALDSYLFSSVNTFKKFFKEFQQAIQKLEENGIAVSYLDNRNIYIDSTHPLLFPAVRLLMGEEVQKKDLLEIPSTSSFSVLKGFLSDSLAVNRDLFPNYEKLYFELQEIKEYGFDKFIDNLDLIQEEVVHPNSLDFDSFDEVRPEEVEDNKLLNILNKLKDFWSGIEPVILKAVDDGYRIFLSFSVRVRASILGGSFLILFFIFGGGEKEGSLEKAPNLKRVNSSTPAGESPKNKVSNSKPEATENLEVHGDDKVEGMRSKQTLEDLSAIQSLQSPLKENQIRVLLQMAKSDDFEVRIASIRTLGEKAPKGNLEVQSSLLESLSDEDYLVRGFAVSSLTAYLEADSVPILEAHREKEQSEIVIAAIDRAIKRLELYKKRR